MKGGLQNVLAVINLYQEKYFDTDNICKTKIENIMFCIYNTNVIFSFIHHQIDKLFWFFACRSYVTGISILLPIFPVMYRNVNKIEFKPLIFLIKYIFHIYKCHWGNFKNRFLKAVLQWCVNQSVHVEEI